MCGPTRWNGPPSARPTGGTDAAHCDALLVLVSIPLGLRAPLLNAFVLPVLLSGILLPMTLAPGWLQTISDINPLKHVVERTREFFVGGYDTSTAWWGAALTVALAVLGWLVRCPTFPA